MRQTHTWTIQAHCSELEHLLHFPSTSGVIMVMLKPAAPADKSVIVVSSKQLCKHHRLKTVMKSRMQRIPEPATEDSLPGWQPDLTSTGCFVCLLSAVAYVVMSTKKKVSAVVKKTSAPKRAKKVRSISMSLDLECPGRIEDCPSYKKPATLANKSPAACLPRSVVGDRYRTVSACEYVEQYLAGKKESQFAGGLGKALPLDEEKAALTKLLTDRFPFQDLPPECKLKVFLFLTPKERGVASQVCSDWRKLMKSSSLWNIVDLTMFPLCHVNSGNHECTELCYSLYRNRVKKFMQYLGQVRPVVKSLRFACDIGDYRDGWLESLQGLMRASHLHQLEVACLNWKETPIKPFYSESRVTWSTNDYNELMHRHKHRQRLFVNFFNNFTALAPNVSKLILPFDWSARSIQALSRLRRLEMLVLEKYFVFQIMDQSAVDQLFHNVPNLRKLILEVWTPSGRGLMLYNLQSDKLEYLDVSQSRGFYLKDIDLPKCEVFKISRHPWNGPLVTSDSMHIPCIYDVLRTGAPNLKQINEHRLHSEWRDVVYEELEAVLRGVCSCQDHKTTWVM